MFVLIIRVPVLQETRCRDFEAEILDSGFDSDVVLVVRYLQVEGAV